MNDPDLKRIILDLLARRRPGASACPTEVARGTGRDDWRALVPAVRQAAADLALEGKILLTQNGEIVCPRGECRGPVRLHLAARPT